MKTAFVILSVILSAVTVLPQGTVIFDNDINGSVVTHVYVSPFSPGGLGGTGMEGNATYETPPGTVDWVGWTPLAGSGWSAQIWAADGFNRPESSLQPAFPITTFRTGAGAGFFVGTTATLPGVPPGDTATLEIRVWNNMGGTITSWAQALAMGPSAGKSSQITVPDVGGIDSGGGVHPPPPLSGLPSFGFYAPIPEPTTWALLTLGGIGLMLFRRRRSPP